VEDADDELFRRVLVLCTMKTMCYIHCYLIEMTTVINCDADAITVFSHPLITYVILFIDKLINTVTECI